MAPLILVVLSIGTIGAGLSMNDATGFGVAGLGVLGVGAWLTAATRSIRRERDGKGRDRGEPAS